MRARTFGLASLLLAVAACCFHAKAGETSPILAPPFPGVVEAIAQFDQLEAPG